MEERLIASEVCPHCGVENKISASIQAPYTDIRKAFCLHNSVVCEHFCRVDKMADGTTTMSFSRHKGMVKMEMECAKASLCLVATCPICGDQCIAVVDQITDQVIYEAPSTFCGHYIGVESYLEFGQARRTYMLQFSKDGGVNAKV